MNAEPRQFRTKQILVSVGVYNALCALADVENMDGPDAYADLQLGLLLSSKGQMQWAVAEWRKRREQFQKDYQERVKQAVADDRIP